MEGNHPESEKEFPVWQLMDGTVVMQTDEPIEEVLQQGKFVWLDSNGKKVQPLSFFQCIRHEFFRLLDSI